MDVITWLPLHTQATSVWVKDYFELYGEEIPIQRAHIVVFWRRSFSFRLSDGPAIKEAEVVFNLH